MIKADLHIHSTCSDGKYHPLEILKWLKAKNIKVASITDHKTNKGSLIAKKYSEKYKIFIVPGVEYSKRGHFGLCHLLIYGIEKEIEDIEKYSIPEIIDFCKDNNYLLILAHPFARIDIFKFPILHVKSFLRKIDGIEIVNGTAGVINNLRTIKWVLKQSFKNWVFTAGSDAHILEAIGKAYLILSDFPKNFDEFIDLLKESKFNFHHSKNPFIVPYLFVTGKIRTMMRRPNSER